MHPRFPKLAQTGSCIFRFLNTFSFWDEKYIVALKVFNGIQLVPKVKPAYHYIAALLSKEDPECWLTLLAQVCRNFLKIKNKNLFQILG